MPTLEITLQHPRDDQFPFTAELRQPGLLSLRRESSFSLSAETLALLKKQDGEPLAYGQTLGELIFQGAVRDLLMQARCDSQAAELHLLLVVEAEALRPLRWERLALPQDGAWTAAALAQGVAFSRYLPSLSDRRFPLIGRLDLQLLAAIASPPEGNDFGLYRFDAAAVENGLSTALGDLPHQVSQDISLDLLAEQLASGEFSLLHIVAHGMFHAKSGETVLYFCGGRSGVEPVPAGRLIQRLKALKRLPHLVFLSTCDSAKAEAESENALGGLAHRLVKQLGIPAVVAMGDKVSVETANRLAEGFYRQLRQHGQPDRALAEAAAPLAERGDVLLPALYSRLGGRPLFSDSAKRPLTRKEMLHGLAQLQTELQQRAPVLLSECEQLQHSFAALPDAEKLSREDSNQRDEILKDLNALSEECLGLDFAGLARGEQPGVYNAACPFPGLYAFTENEQQYYFGREQLSQDLAQRLQQHPFLAILGMSGSGKSSLALAGIFPRLQQQQADLQKLYLKPGNTPLASLDAALQIHAAASQPCALIIDQFEELFTLCQDKAQQQAFVDRIMALELRPGDCLMLTMRADFWGECAPFAQLKAAMQSHMELVAPMNSAELRSAMEQQAQQTGLRFEADLSHNILAEVENEPGAMPLLQHLLQELWKRRHGRWLKTEEYHQLGGIKQAIAHSADGFYQSLDKTAQEHCRNIFVRLTRLGEAEGDEHRDTRRRVSLDELVPAGADAQQIKALAANLANTRLVMVSAEHIEVAHEALIQHWQRLRGWLNEDRFALSLLAEVRRQAQSWEAEQRADSQLPRWNAKLEQAEELSHNPRFGATAQELAFLQACRELKEREEREEARQQQLLRSRLRLAIAVSVVALLAMLVAVSFYQKAEERTEQVQQEKQRADEQRLFAEAQRQQAEQEKQRADAQRLLAEQQTALAEEQRQQAEHQKQRAEAQTQLAEQEKQRAEEQTRLVQKEQQQALLNQSRFLADQARRLNERGASAKAIRVALEALPQSSESRPQRPYLQAATQQVYQGVVQHWRGQLAHQQPLVGSVYSPDGQYFATWTDEQIYLWDAATRQIVHVLQGEQRHSIRKVGFAANSRLLFSTDTPTGADTSSPQASVALWDVGSGQLLQLIRAYPYGALDVAFSPDSRLLAIATGYPKNAAGFWEVSSGEQVQNFTEHSNWIEHIAFSAGGRWFVTASKDKTARVWEVSSGKLLHTLQHDNELSAVQFSADGKLLATATIYPDNRLQLWQRDSGELVRSFAAQDNAVSQILFTADAQSLISLASDAVRVWALDSGELRHQLQDGDATMMQMQLRPDGNLAVASADGVVRWWNLATGELSYQTASHCQGQAQAQDCPLNGLSFSADGNELLTSAGSLSVADQNARLWNARNGAALRVLKGHQYAVEQAIFAPDGRQIASSSQDESVRLWDAQSSQLLHTLAVPATDQQASSLAFSADGRLLLTVSAEQAQLWSTHSGQLLRSLNGHQARIYHATFSPDQQLIATVSADKTARLWEARSGKLLRILEGHSENLTYAAFSADSQYLVTVSEDASAKIWAVSSGDLLQTLEHQGAVLHAAFSADGKRLATGSRDKLARLWDAHSGALLHSLSGHCTGRIGEYQNDYCGVLQVAFAPDGQSLVTASTDFDARVWDASSGQQKYLLDQHCAALRDYQPGPWEPWDCRLNHAEFSADGQLLVTASQDKTARVWRAADGELLYVLQEHSAAVTQASFSADGQMILTASSDENLRLWPLFKTPEDLRKAAVEQLPNSLGDNAERLNCKEREQLFLEMLERCEPESRSIQADSAAP